MQTERRQAMVIITDEAGKSVTCRHPNTHEVISTLQNTGEGMVDLVKSLEEAYLDVNSVNATKLAIGQDAKKILEEFRGEITDRLVLYKNHHLPLGKEVVNNVQTILRRFGVVAFEDFKPKLPLLKVKLKSAKAQAAGVNQEYVELAAELTAFRIGALKELNGLKKEMTPQMKKAAEKSKTKTKSLRLLGPGMSVGGVLGGVVIAVGLITEGGLIAACPPAAPIVIASSIALAATAAGVCEKATKHYKATEEEFANILAKTENALKCLEHITQNGVRQFTEAMTAVASFFDILARRLGDLEEASDDANDAQELKEVSPIERETLLKSLHKEINSNAQELIDACIAFIKCCNQVEVSIQSLNVLETRKAYNLVKSWKEKNHQNHLYIAET